MGASLAVSYAAMGAKLIITGRNETGLKRVIQACEDVGCKRHNVSDKL